MTTGHAHELRFFPEAVDDLAQARDWYNNRSAGLGEDFIAEFWETVESIDSHPRAGTIVGVDDAKNEVRRTRFNGRFPFGVVHFVADDGSALVLVAVHHDRRRPGHWADRIAH